MINEKAWEKWGNDTKSKKQVMADKWQKKILDKGGMEHKMGKDGMTYIGKKRKGRWLDKFMK